MPVEFNRSYWNQVSRGGRHFTVIFISIRSIRGRPRLALVAWISEYAGISKASVVGFGFRGLYLRLLSHLLHVALGLPDPFVVSLAFTPRISHSPQTLQIWFRLCGRPRGRVSGRLRYCSEYTCTCVCLVEFFVSVAIWPPPETVTSTTAISRYS